LIATSVAVHLDDLVLAEHAAALVDQVDHHLGPAPAVQRAGGRERAGVVVEDPDLDRLPLRVGGRGRHRDERDGRDEDQRQDDACGLHAAMTSCERRKVAVT